jgi:hypothetical protein
MCVCVCVCVCTLLKKGHGCMLTLFIGKAERCRPTHRPTLSVVVNNVVCTQRDCKKGGRLQKMGGAYTVALVSILAP